MKNKMIAHRGLHNEEVPENSLLAFKLALEKNVAIELDVHVLKDNSIVVFHDNNLKRMTGIDKELRDCTYEEIKKLKLLNSNEHIPLLNEVLSIVDKKVLIDIELKDDEPKHLLEDELIKILSDYEGKIILKSFDYKIVKYLKKKANYPVGLLLGNIDRKKELGKFKKIFFKSNFFIRYINPDFLACDYHILDYDSVVKYRKNKPVYTWTIRDKETFEKIKEKADYYIAENII